MIIKQKHIIYLILLLVICYCAYFLKVNHIFAYQIRYFLNKEIHIKKYNPGLNFFSDRNYTNHKNDEKIETLYLVQIPRHFKENIFIKAKNDVILYRVLCNKNKNEKYINWNKESFDLKIIGRSCSHTNVIKKKFKKGIIKIDAGGPVVSDPILLNQLTSVR